MRDIDVLIAGAGPAGLLVGSALVRQGLRTVLVDPHAGTPGPHAGHVHLLSDETWAAMCDQLPNLERRAVARGAPVAPMGAAMLDGDLSDWRRAWPDRARLDRSLFDCAVSDIGVPVLRKRIGAIGRHRGRWQAAGYRAGWLIDASGGSRATLRAVAEVASIDWLEWGDRRGYASLVLEDMAWPDSRVGHGLRAADGSGLALRKMDARRTLVTLQIVQPENLPDDSPAFFDRVAGIAPPGIARWISGGSPVSGVRKWSSRRSGGILADADLAEIGWMAVGDALLNTAPHQGQGLAQLVQQAELIGKALDAGHGLSNAANRLTRWAEQRSIAATLSEELAAVAAA